jgi:hypothetical protein
MTRRSIIALGVVQCVNWGVLYYAFGALLLPVQRDLGISQAMVAGAFSVALLVSAVIAPRIGRLCDAGHGVRLLQGGAVVSALLLWMCGRCRRRCGLCAVGWTGMVRFRF